MKELQVILRPALESDISAMKTVLDHCELFPSEFLDDMISGYFEDSESEDIWFVAENGEEVVGLAYCAPMKFAEGTYNLYAIGVHRDWQGKGIGQQMMGHLEDLLREMNARILIVETSGLAEMALTRAFYHKCSYIEEAEIRDFWAEGDSKVIFWKKLTA